MTQQDEPRTDEERGSEYERTGQHGPEMDDTQVEATEALRDEWPAATPEGTTGQE